MPGSPNRFPQPYSGSPMTGGPSHGLGEGCVLGAEGPSTASVTSGSGSGNPGSIQQRLEPACVVRGVRISVEGRQAASAERRAASESAGYGAAS